MLADEPASGQAGIFSASYRYQPISSRRNCIIFCCYLHKRFINQHRLWADGILMPHLRESLLVVMRNAFGDSATLNQ
jgi:hypothetical protein